MESEKTKLTEQLSKFDDWYKAVILIPTAPSSHQKTQTSSKREN